jgi:hypothetical protein
VRQRQTDNMPTKPVNDLIADIRQEILMSVVALFDQRNMCGINIAFSREPSTTRLEVFDDAVYLSWYQGPKSAKLPFPETFRFPHGSFLYEVYAQEVRRRHEIAEHTLTFRRNTTEAELLTSLERLTGTSIGLDDLTTWRTKYAAFVRSVEGSIGNA